MQAEKIAIGNSYQCKSPILDNSIIGIVEKKYDLTALIVVADSKVQKDARLIELNHRLIVPFEAISEVS
ncbi:hypothetical protein C7P63_04060 [Vagococcus humatus]|uniref:DUF2187 domain-containing protein n=2 Tax=Vagococcus humatus TaxID=1889241 RepID=A0A3R9YY99_9ENTE|nr:hypothetical protein C7P63_04060 [Vagococcus humatus]